MMARLNILLPQKLAKVDGSENAMTALRSWHGDKDCFELGGWNLQSRYE